MRASFLVGLLFGGINLVTNIAILLPIKDRTIGVILASGLLFFCCLFSVLFTKKQNGYQLSWSQGMKAAIQSGIIQGILYFISLVLIQNYISPNFFPELHSIKQYLLILNINIIAFSLFSTIFGFIASGLFHTK